MKIQRLCCEINSCRKTFRTQSALDSHIQNEHGSAEYSSSLFTCLQCSKVLSTKQSLKEHLYTHTGEKPYKCLEAGCGLMFRQSSQLSNHRKSHQNIHPRLSDNSTIDLKQLSFLLSTGASYIYNVPLGPYTVQDALLPKLNPRTE